MKGMVTLNNPIIEQHVLFKRFGKSLYDLAKKDYPHDHYFSDHKEIKCIDLDAVEKDKGGDNERTMDSIIGTKVYNEDNGRFSQPSLMLIELRMGYKKATNLSASKMRDKYRKSRELLGYDTPLAKENYYVFDDNIIEEVRSLFNRYRNEESQNKYMFACSVTELTTKVLVLKLPVRKLIDVDVIVKRCSDYLNQKDIDAVIKQLNYWSEEYNKFSSRNNVSEAENLKKAFNKICPMLENYEDCMNEDQILDVEIFKETHPMLFN